MLQGFDVSAYQAGLDMDAAREAGMRFVLVRASTGIDRDLACRDHLRRAHGRLLRGTYHALQPGVSARDQAHIYYQALVRADAFRAELPPALDVEKIGVDEFLVRQFLDELRLLWDRLPLIYTSLNKWHRLVGHNREWARGYPLWVAHWNVPEPRLPTPWTRWAIWQHTVGHVSFWPRKIDLNLYAGGEADLRRLG